MRNTSFLIAVTLLVLLRGTSNADLVNGLLYDFQDGTVQGWDGGTVTVVPDSGPLGPGDFSLELANGGVANRFAMFNLGVNGIILPEVKAITADIMRPSGLVTGQLRLVLFGNDGTRWTSTIATEIVGDGLWNQYSFSILEADLTRVFGSGSYSSLTGDLNRIMFRHDPGSPSSGGSPLAGTMFFDNITAVPETSTGVFLLMGLATYLTRRFRTI